LIAVRSIERELALRALRLTAWRARFLADLMLAKVKLRYEMGWMDEKDR
jgi:hypothetical protein